MSGSRPASEGSGPESGKTNRTATGETWVICQVFYPDTQSTSQLLSDVFAGLAARGNRVRVLAGYPGLHTGGVPPAQETWNQVLIVRGGLRASVKRGAGLRLLTYASYSWFVLWRLLRAPRGRRVFVVTNPPFMPVLVWLASRLRGHRFIVMLLDIYPEGLTAVGRLRVGGLADRLWRWANRRAFAAAEELWVLGRDMARLVEQRYGVAPAKVRYVPHWSPVAVTSPVQAEQTRLWSRLGLQGKFVVQYSGNMGLWHDMKVLVRAAELLRSHDRVHFLFIGAGMRRASAEKLAADLELRNITWLSYQSREDLTDTLACCHVALISLRAGLEGVAVPCKLYGILASGRAVLAQVPAGSEVALAVSEERCGRVVPPGDAAKLAACIMELATASEETTQMGIRAHAAYCAKYTLAAGVEAFVRGLAAWPEPGERRGG